MADKYQIGGHAEPVGLAGRCPGPDSNRHGRLEPADFKASALSSQNRSLANLVRHRDPSLTTFLRGLRRRGRTIFWELHRSLHRLHYVKSADALEGHGY
jgi:hypothetical protein